MKLKLPSISYLTQAASESFLRFPFTIISAFLGVCISIFLVEGHDNLDNMFPYINLLLAFALGIPLYFCVAIYSEKHSVSKKLKTILFGAATVVLVLIYFSLPNSEETNNTSLPYIRYAVFNAIVHLLVSFIPYIKGAQLNGFWNYNKNLFIRFWTAILYSGFLYVGLILALVALDLLFDVNIHDELYFEFYIAIMGLFNTWFFVTGVPKNLDELENVYTYPKGLKIFAQFILLPLLVLYLVILYAYVAKITLEWDWPKGLMAYLVSIVSILGILTFLLIHPYGNASENSWIKKFTNAYYFILFPLIVVLFIAIWIRINDYGITINRYLIVLLGVWLTIVASYFMLQKKNIKFIPISLAIILAVTSFGPWGMFTLSENSQVNRLKKILKNHQLLEDGKIKNEVLWSLDITNTLIATKENTNKGILNDSINDEVRSILNYLDDHHGFLKIKPLLKQNIDSLVKLSADSNRYINEAEIYMGALGLDYHQYYNSEYNYFSYSSQKTNVTNVKDNDYLLEFNMYDYSRDEKESTFTINGVNYNLKYKDEEKKMTLISDADTAIFDLNSMISALNKKYNYSSKSDIEQSNLSVMSHSKQFNIRLDIHSISFNKEVDTLTTESIKGFIFLKSKN
jgi:hypothetical protein